MKKLFYSLYAFFFNIFSIFGIDEKRVTLVSMHNADFYDSLGYVENEIKKRSDYKIIKITRRDLTIVKDKGIKELVLSICRAIRFFTAKAYSISRSKYIFLNDNFMPLSSCNISKNTKVVQLWHAEGAFKRFGQDIEQPEEIREREIKGNSKLTYVICSSKSVAPIYSSAFNIPIERVLPLGSPRTDYYFEKHDTHKMRQDFDEKYPQAKGKKLLLYAPTFREQKESDDKLIQQLDIGLLNKEIGEEYALLIRLHPQVHSENYSLEYATDVTDYKNVNELCLLSDVLITDYSSICMDFSLQDKPMIFFAFDLDNYNKTRSFYYDYENYVPGPIAKSTSEIIDIIKNDAFNKHKNNEFQKFNFDTPDGNAAKRVVDFILK